MQWKTVISNPHYEISNTGQVRNIHTGHRLRQQQHYHGYMTVVLSYQGRRTYYIHRLMAEVFIRPLIDNEEVNHKDGDKQNNDPNNLKITSRKGNVQHAWDNGLMSFNLPRGYPLQAGERWLMYKLLKEGYETGIITQTAIGKMFNRRPSTVSMAYARIIQK